LAARSFTRLLSTCALNFSTLFPFFRIISHTAAKLLCFLKEITMPKALFRTLATSFAATALVLSITGCASTMAPSQALSILEPANNATVPTTF
jgi:hypothetical protein